MKYSRRDAEAQRKVPMVRLGDYIEELDERNGSQFGITRVRGITTQKEFIETKANMEGVSLASYKVCKPGWFAYVSDTSRRGDKVSLAFNAENIDVLVSSISTVFKTKDNNILSPEYLNIAFNSSEFDRLARFNSWGSARETFDFSELCRVHIPLPSIDVQRKVVAAWEGLRKLQRDNEALAAALKKVECVIVAKLKHTKKRIQIRELIDEVFRRNEEYSLGVDDVRGLNIEKKLVSTVANLENVSLGKYKRVEEGEFVYSSMQTGRDRCIRIGLHEKGSPILVSPAYTVFKMKPDAPISSEMLFMLFRQLESDRYGWFISDGSVRASLEFPNFCDIRIPLIEPLEQKAAVALYKSVAESERIAAKAKALAANIVPSLIRYAAEGGAM